MGIFAVPVEARFESDIAIVRLNYAAKGLIAQWLSAMVQLVSPSITNQGFSKTDSAKAVEILEEQMNLENDAGLTLYLRTTSGQEIREQLLMGYFDPVKDIVLLGVFVGDETDGPFYQQFKFGEETLNRIEEDHLGFLVICLPQGEQQLRAAAVATTDEHIWRLDAYTIPEGLRTQIIQTGLGVMSN